jgi:pimeloyl-ACP methyl ester carboxylesterase
VWPAKTQENIPLICVHGLTRLGQDFDDLAEKLSQTRDIYAPDMPGRGQSDFLSEGAFYTYPQYAADCLALLNARGIQQVDWLGTSMGGLIGMVVASEATSPIRRFILNDIGPFLPLPAMQRLGTYVGKPMHFEDLRQAEIYCRQVYCNFGIEGEAAWKKFTADTVKPDEKGGFKLHYDMKIAEAFLNLTKDIDLWPLYDKITCPTLVLRGENSDTLSAATAEEMTKRGPKAKLITFKNCGHAPALIDEAQIEEVRRFVGA